MPFEIDGEIKIVFESDECSFVNGLGDKRIPKPWRNENETMCCESEIVLDILDYSKVDKLDTVSISSWGLMTHYYMQLSKKISRKQIF